MFDLQLRAMQGDVTRVITFQLARETSNRTYPEIGVSDATSAATNPCRSRTCISRCLIKRGCGLRSFGDSKGMIEVL